VWAATLLLPDGCLVHQDFQRQAVLLQHVLLWQRPAAGICQQIMLLLLL
jgi:hypothetical protein